MYDLSDYDNNFYGYYASEKPNGWITVISKKRNPNGVELAVANGQYKLSWGTNDYVSLSQSSLKSILNSISNNCKKEPSTQIWILVADDELVFRGTMDQIKAELNHYQSDTTFHVIRAENIHTLEVTTKTVYDIRIK